MSGSNPLPAGQWANIAPLGAGTLAPSNNGGEPAALIPPPAALRGPPALFTRQPYQGSPPAVTQATGFGTGSGAGIRNDGADADKSQGLVRITVGAAPAGTGSLGLNFPAGITTGAYVWLADWATIVAGVPSGNTITLTWTATRPLIPGEVLLLAYQTLVSN